MNPPDCWRDTTIAVAVPSASQKRSSSLVARPASPSRSPSAPATGRSWAGALSGGGVCRGEGEGARGVAHVHGRGRGRCAEVGERRGARQLPPYQRGIRPARRQQLFVRPHLCNRRDGVLMSCQARAGQAGTCYMYVDVCTWVGRCGTTTPTHTHAGAPCCLREPRAGCSSPPRVPSG